MKKKITIIAVLLFIVDQISKLILDRVLVLNKSITLLDKFIYITKVYNTGVSFSMLSGKRVIIILINIIVLVFLYFYMNKFKNNKRNIYAFGLVCGGLLGNLLDRIMYGHVIDFIDIHIFGYDYPVFNLADSFIVIGIFLLIYAIYIGEDNENNCKRAK